MPRPFKLLPFKDYPRNYNPSDKDPLFFYNNFTQYFIEDFVRIMDTGIKIDYDAVENLRLTVTDVLQNVSTYLENNEHIKKCLKVKYKNICKKHKTTILEKTRDVSYYFKSYNSKNTVHRTYAINTYLIDQQSEDLVQDKWLVKDIKELLVYFPNSPCLLSILDKSFNHDYVLAQKAMKNLAKDKAALWNKGREDKAKELPNYPKFNPASVNDTRLLFETLKIEPLEYSKKSDKPSWGRKQLEDVRDSTTNREIKELLNILIDFSFSSIIKNNFLNAFDKFTVDGTLYGSIKLHGAKSYRPTSQSPNLLNMPSTGSIYAKPLKKCFVAPEGKLIVQADYSSLEDVILANITKDQGKIDIQLDKTLDAHCYNALSYYPEQIEEIIGGYGSYKDEVRRFKVMVDEGNEVLSSIRQDSKPATFKLAYLGYPDSDKGGVITKEIYDNYHNKLYPKVRQYLDEYVIPFVRDNGYLHLGFGCNLYSDNIDESFRTMFNAGFQFFSILTLISINEMFYRIDKENLSNDIKISSTIYDSIYANVTSSSEIVHWYNKNLVEIGSKDFVKGQIVPNTLNCAIGRNWAEEIKIPPKASLAEVSTILKTLK